MTFSIPSPVELTQLKIQYQRNVGTARASKRIELGATAPAPGSTSRASTFLSATTEDYVSDHDCRRRSCHQLGAVRSSHPLPHLASLAPLVPRRGSWASAARAQPARRCHPRRDRALPLYGVMKSCVNIRP